MKWETFNFSDDFQDMIIACLVTHPDKFFGFGQIIRPTFFNGPAAIEVVQHMLNYQKKYGKHPNFSMLANYAFHRAARNNKEHAKEMVDYVDKIAQLDTSDWQAILDMSVEFAKERAIFEGLRQIHAAQTAGKMETVSPVEVMTKALSVGINLNDMGWSLYHDSGKAIDAATRRDYGIMTGFSELDKLWKFGWGPGWLIVPLAPPKKFKTTFVINLAMNMSTYGQADVIYYACEIQQELAMMRAIYNMTGFTEEEIWASPKKYKKKVEEVLHRKMYGNVWFKGFPAKGVTMDQIKDHARYVIKNHGLNPKAIIIDYAETVKPASVKKDTPDWREQSDIYIQARALGSELGCCVIMPDRCNKDTVNQNVPSPTSFQGSFEKAGVVDIALGLCSTDEEHMQGRIRYFVFLNRHGAALKHYEGRIDSHLMRMTIDREIPYDPEDDAKQAKERAYDRRNSRRKSKAAADFEATQRA